MKKILFIILFIGLMYFPFISEAAIARDTSNKADGNPVTSLTVPLTIAGSNRLLIATLTVFAANSGWTAVWNGTDMGSPDVQYNSTWIQLVWIMVAPDAVAGNLVLSWTGSGNATAFGASYTGVSQTETPDATSTETAVASTAYDQSITTVADNAWTIWYLRKESGSAATAGTGSTLVQEIAGNGVHLYDNQGNGPITPAGAYTMNASDDNVASQGVMLSFAPAAEAGGGAVLDTIWDDFTE